MLRFSSFLVSTDVTNLFRQRFRKPCADENVASASSCLHTSLPWASALVALGDSLPRPRCRGCFPIFGEYYCAFFKLPRHVRETFLPRCFHTLPRVQPHAHTDPVMTRAILPKTNDRKTAPSCVCSNLWWLNFQFSRWETLFCHGLFTSLPFFAKQHTGR